MESTEELEARVRALEVVVRALIAHVRDTDPDGARALGRALQFLASETPVSLVNMALWPLASALSPADADAPPKPAAPPGHTS